MNRQELFNGKIKNSQIELDTTYLPFIKPDRRNFSDMAYPHFFSGWPYFILILAALLMGSTSITSRGNENQDLVQFLNRTITSTESFLNRKKEPLFNKTGEYQEPNRCELNSTELATRLNVFSKQPWFSTESHPKNSF